MKRLLLAGGGQAHVFVLRALAKQRPDNVDVVLVTPSDQLIYTGMLPGWTAGHYQLPELTISLAPLLRAAHVRLVPARVTALDLQRRVAHTDGGDAIDFDLLSIASGPAPNVDGISGAREHTLPLRPLTRFVEAWQQISSRAQSSRAPFCLTIIGAGAGGIEIALAAKYRLPKMHVQLITGDEPILPGHNARVRALAHAALRNSGVQLVAALAERVEPRAVVLGGGERLSSDQTLLMTGAAAESWPRDAGLATDESGFIAINDKLQSTSHDFVFAAGDAATMLHARRPKSGVYAVRAGPKLAANLLAAISGVPLKAYRPQRRALYLLAAGAKHAIASWGPLAFSGRWVWHWKDRIDRGYIAKFKQPENREPAT
jgi:pyridine nucleotide-disulfide oxidoreductase family protein